MSPTEPLPNDEPAASSTARPASLLITFSCLTWPARVFVVLVFSSAAAIALLRVYNTLVHAVTNPVALFLIEHSVASGVATLLFSVVLLLILEPPRSSSLRAYSRQLSDRLAAEYAQYQAAVRQYHRHK